MEAGWTLPHVFPPRPPSLTPLTLSIEGTEPKGNFDHFPANAAWAAASRAIGTRNGLHET
jgi:hypothetical protein